jgi:hypothetical protein
MRALPIALLFGSWYGQPFDLSASYFLKFKCPAFPWLGDEEKDQAIPGLAELVVGWSTHLHNGDDAKWVFR